MKKVMVLVLALVLVAVVAPSFATLLADSQADWQTVVPQTGNNGWWYGWYNQNNVASLDANGGDIYGTGWYYYADPGDNWSTAVGQTLMRGQSYFTWVPMRRWVSTVSGSVEITGTIAKAATSTVKKTFSILVDGVSVYTIDLQPDDVSTHNYDVTVPGLKVGSNVDFLWNVNNALGSDSGTALEGNMAAQINTVDTGVSANVTLQGFSGDLSLAPIRVDVLNSAGGVVATKTTTPTSNPMAVAVTGISSGTYTVRASACKWLSQTTSATVTTGVTSVTLSLPNGDINGDNVVEDSDYAIMSGTWYQRGQ